MNPPPMSPSGATPPKRHGCFFYGCITSLVIALVLGIIFVLSMAYIIRAANRKITEYTDTQPVALPQDSMSASDLKQLKDRLSVFGKALDSHSNVPPFVLTGHDLNGLLGDAFSTAAPPMDKFKNHLYVAVEGDRIKGQVSLAADKIVHVPFIHTEGRYLNGAVAFKVLLTNQQLSVFIDQVEVKGKPVPDEYMTGLRQANFAQNVQDNPSNAAAIGRFETIEIKDGKIIITPKKPEAQ